MPIFKFQPEYGGLFRNLGAFLHLDVGISKISSKQMMDVHGKFHGPTYICLIEGDLGTFPWDF